MTSNNEIVVTVYQPKVTVTATPNQVTVGSPGPQGPIGPPGPAGGSFFEEVWSSPVTTVIVNHNLNRYPSVTIIIGGFSVGADVTYNTLNQLTVSFGTPQTAGRIECL